MPAPPAAAPPAAGFGRPFFVVGCPRSGTTLVSRLLDAHPRLAVYHESQFYPTFRSALHLYGDLGDRQGLVAFLEDVREGTRLQGVDPPPLDEFLANLVAPSFAGVLGTLLGLYARSRGKVRGADKTPGHYLYLDEIQRDFPGSEVIFVLRDPRDTALSLRKAFATPADAAARMWSRSYRALREAAQPVHRVRYEELVEAPEAGARALCEHLGEAYDPAMLEFHREIPERISTRAHLGKLQGPVDAASVGRFRELSERELHRIESICALGMEECGYPFVTRPEPALRDARGEIGALGRLRERALYYGFNRERWRRGAFRWRLEVRHRARRLLGRRRGREGRAAGGA